MSARIGQTLLAPLLFVWIVAATACATQQPMPEPAVLQPALTMRAADTCSPDREQRFFPSGIFPDPAPNPISEVDVLTNVLAAMHEAPLSCGPANDSYRFLFFPVFSFSFDAVVQPTMGRISRSGNRWTATLVRLKNARTGEVVERRVKTLTDDQARTALTGIRTFALWQDPGYRSNPDVHDGAAWIVEGRRGTEYAAVVRHNQDEVALRKLAFVFFDVLGANPDPLRRPDDVDDLRRSSNASIP